MSDSTPTFANFFELFEQPVSFEINTQKLDATLRTLQQKFHPDKMSLNANEDEIKASDVQSEKISSVINHAYAVLLNPDSRANYLLELSGQELNDNASIADLDFLDDAMDIRIRLDDANDSATLQSLKVEIQPKLDKQSMRFKTAYSTKDWINAIDATQKLKFLVKLNKDIDTAIDATYQQDDDEDDLYL